MGRGAVVLSFVLGLPFAASWSACSVIPGIRSKESDELDRVDELLTRIESVQAQATISKERAEAALAELQVLIAPDFAGDPVEAYGRVILSVDASKKQADKLGSCIEPLKETAHDVFTAWTRSLESFGNNGLRRQSQNRMVETRARCESVVTTVTAAHIAYEALNADVRDHALFLRHDFNASSVAAVAGGVGALDEQLAELDARLDACIEASRRYVESSALRGQLAVAGNQIKPASEEPRGEARARRRAARSAEQEAAETGEVARKVADGTN